MKTGTLRVRRIKFHDGRVIAVHPSSHDRLRETMWEGFKASPSWFHQFKGDLAGFATVCWDFQGRTAASWQIHKNSPIGQKIMPMLVHGAITEELFKNAARRVVSERLD